MTRSVADLREWSVMDMITITNELSSSSGVLAALSEELRDLDLSLDYSEDLLMNMWRLTRVLAYTQIRRFSSCPCAAIWLN